MVGFTQPARRFSLVLLEEAEDYVADWIASCTWPKGVSGNWQSLDAVNGTLRLCSKSLFFEPDDVRVPVARLPFKATQNLEPHGRQTFNLSTTLVIKMKANMADAPYVTERGRVESWGFSLAYAQTSDVLPLIHQYLAASRMFAAEREAALQALAQQRAEAAAFDTSRLVDFMEALRYDAPAAQHTPLVREAGRLAITDSRLYFQPLDNVAGDTPARIHPLAGVAAVTRRRSSLRPLGLELFFLSGEDGQLAGPTWGTPSAFFAFDSEAEREKVISILMDQPVLGTAIPGGRTAAAACASILEAHGEWLQRVTRAWQHGRVSNLDYLLFCNLAAGRSFNDLTQWPVFPWVLADYDSAELRLDDPACYRDLTRPMGAINPQRLDVLRKRFREMPREQGIQPFLYGTHYSCPGYVMFWLVRAAPGHLLRLQNGRFDSADRLFINIGDSYTSATSNAADVKELIPEFFMTDPRFLVNGEQLPLGTRQNGAPVGDVELPRWAGGASDFLKRHRAALESSVVSANLHHWIDLVFGHKQQGRAAEDADNVFHHLTYEGAVDVAAVTDARERRALEVQINEFGQCPRQIFGAPHPARLVCPSAADASALAEAAWASKPGRRRSNSSNDGDRSGRALSLALLNTIMAATSLPHAEERPVDPKAQEQLRALDMGRMRISDPAQTIEGDASVPTAPGVKVPCATPEARSGSPQRLSGDRLRNWGTNLGGQLSSFVGSLTKERIAAGAAQASASSQSRLKGLFYRPNGTAQATAGAGATRHAERAEAAHADRAMPSGAADVSQTTESATVVDGGGRDAEAEALASALGAPAVGLLAGSRDGGDAAEERHAAASPADVQARGEQWGAGVSERLSRPPRRISAYHAAVSDVACGLSSACPMVYCVSQTGTLRIFDAGSGAQIRSANLSGMPLTCLALLEDAGDAGHPTVVTAGFDNKVYAYSVDFGRVLGSCEAHDDTVSCMAVRNGQLLTGSFDGTVKAWSLAEGREPWASHGGPSAEVETETAVHSLDSLPSGLVLSAAEEGVVAAWDLRSQSCAWQAEVHSASAAAVRASPDGEYVLTASPDTGFCLLDVRKAGAALSSVGLASAPHSCRFDGDTAAAGADDGKVYLWDVAQQQGRQQGGGFKAPSPDGLYTCLQSGAAPISSIDVLSEHGRLHLITGHKDGSLSVFSDSL